jgi:hypothetical protein
MQINTDNTKIIRIKAIIRIITNDMNIKDGWL